MVADWRLDVRCVDIDKFGKHVHGVHPQFLSVGELEVVGLPSDGHDDGVRLREALGAFRRKE